MPPRFNLFTANKAASAFRRSGVSTVPQSIALCTRIQPAPIHKRWSSSQDNPKSIPLEEQKFPTQDPLPSVSEEAAALSNIMEKEKSCDGQPGAPELEQGSPVSEVGGIIYDL